MRTSRLSTPWTLLLIMLVGAIILALLGVLAMSVVAQDEDETPTATYVTGTIIQGLGTGDSEYWEGGGIGHGRGMMTETVVEWSDPRLPSRVLRVINLDEHQPSAMATASSVRLEPLRQVYGEGQGHLLAPEDGPDGAWAGTSSGFLGFPTEEPPPVTFGLMTLTGEGAYEGLSAMIADTWKDGTPAFEGYIFEGALPPVPDPVEANPPPME